MLRTVAIASAALRRMVLASPRASILRRVVSAGPVLYRRPDLSVHLFPISRPFALALDLSRSYAGGPGKRIPYDEEDLDSDDKEILEDKDLGSDAEETWDDIDSAGDLDVDEEDFSGESTDESD